MHKPGRMQSFIANGAIAARRIVNIESSRTVSQATSKTTANLGVTELACNDCDSVDVVLTGIAEVEAGGTINHGDLVATDSSGRAVAASAGDMVLGVAINGASAGEYVPVRLSPGEKPEDLSNYAAKSDLSGYAVKKQTFEAAADIPTKSIVKIVSGGKIAPYESADQTQCPPVGVSAAAILQGESGDIIISGAATVAAGESISYGDWITGGTVDNTKGLAKKASKGNQFLGMALNVGSAGDDISVLIAQGMTYADTPVDLSSYATKSELSSAISNLGSDTRQFRAALSVSAKRIATISNGDIINADGGSNVCIGVVKYDCPMDGAAEVIVSGVAAVEAGQSINSGSWITTGPGGKAVTAQKGDCVLGVALNAASNGNDVFVLISPGRTYADNPVDLSNYATKASNHNEITFSCNAESAILKGSVLAFSTGSGYVHPQTYTNRMPIGVALENNNSSTAVKVATTGICQVLMAQNENEFAIGDYVCGKDGGYACHLTSSNNKYVGIAVKTSSNGYVDIVISPGIVPT